MKKIMLKHLKTKQVLLEDLGKDAGVFFKDECGEVAVFFHNANSVGFTFLCDSYLGFIKYYEGENKEQSIIKALKAGRKVYTFSSSSDFNKDPSDLTEIVLENKEEENVVHIDNIDLTKIYCCVDGDSIWILEKAELKRWYFRNILMTSGDVNLNNFTSQQTIKEKIKQGFEVYELKNIKELKNLL